MIKEIPICIFINCGEKSFGFNKIAYIYYNSIYQAKKENSQLMFLIIRLSTLFY